MMRRRKDDAQFRGNFGGAINLSIKAIGDTGEFEGYGSVFDNVDRGDDICVRGCFAASIRDRGAGGIKMLYHHRTDQVIGVWNEMREDDRGLYCKGRLLLTIEKGREAYELMKAEAIDGLSIGYRTIRDEWDREKNVRRLLEVDLREVSVVTFPMNELATIQLVKGDKLPSEREFETFLKRDAGFSAQQAKRIVSSGYKSLLAERDAGGGDDEYDSILGSIAKLASAMKV